MKRLHTAPVFVGLLIFVALLATGCNVPRLATGPTETETQIVELGNADQVNAAIRMGVGKLTVSPGTDDLLDATFRYNVPAWKPVVSYESGDLLVTMPDTDGIEGIPDSNIEYEWDLMLNGDVPMDLKIELGAGESELNLGGLNLTHLDISSGVGDSTVDLSGKWQQSTAVAISGGVGSLDLTVPSDIGVRVDVQQGLGNVTVNGLQRSGDVFTSEAYGSADVNLDINISAGVGEIDITAVE